MGQRPDTDVIVFVTGMLMDGSRLETVFGFSTSGLIIPLTTLLYDQYLQPVIVQPILATESTDSPTVGNIILENDGRLNYLLNYSFGDRPVEVYQVRDQDYDDRSLLFSGLIDQLIVGRQVEVVVRDILSLLDTEAVNGKFTGENILPYGIEGEQDLEGQTKPRLFGKAFNMSPVFVNTAKLIYGLNWDKDGDTAPLYAITEVRDGGAIMPIEGDVATAEILQDATVSGGYVQTCLAEGLMRLGSTPDGNVTADAQSVEDSSIPEVLEAVIVESGINEVLLRYLNVDEVSPPCPVGVYAEANTSYRDIVNSILLPLDLFLWADSVNNLKIGRLGVQPGDTEKLIFIEHRDSPMPEENIAVISASVVGQTYSAYKLDYKYYRNYTVQSADELHWVSREQWGKFAYEWSTYEDNRQYVKEVFKEARQDSRDTAIQCTTPDEVEDEVQTLLDRAQYPHQQIRVRFKIPEKFIVPLSSLIDELFPITFDSTLTRMDSTFVSMDRTTDLVTYLPSDSSVLLGDVVGLQSPYVPDSDNTVYQVKEVETNIRTNEISMLVEGKLGTVVFRGIETPIITGIGPQEFCYKVPPPALHASEFTTVDLGEPHISSDWKIAEDRYFYILKDQVVEDTGFLETWQPTRELDPDVTYYAKVRYRTATYRSRWSEPFEFILRHMVDTPTITSPTHWQEFLYPNDMPITITASAFVPKIAGLAHYSTDWKITNLFGGIHTSYDDTSNLTSYTVSLRAGILRIAVRYRADTGCLSDWGIRTITVIEGDCDGSGAVEALIETLPEDEDLVTS